MKDRKSWLARATRYIIRNRRSAPNRQEHDPGIAWLYLSFPKSAAKKYPGAKN